MYQIGVDIGGTNIKIGLVDDSLELLEQASIPFPHEGAQTVADRLAEAVRGGLTAAGITEAQRQSIGVVIPGSIDPTGEVVINAYNLGFHDVPFKKLIAAHFPNTPGFMANDANGAALAELYKGAFVGCRPAVLLTLGTGLGGGIILDDAPARHKRNDAAVLSALAVRENGSGAERVLQALNAFDTALPSAAQLAARLGLEETRLAPELDALLARGEAAAPLPGRFIASAVLGALGGVAGLAVSFQWELPSGVAIIFVLTASLIVAKLLSLRHESAKPRRG